MVTPYLVFPGTCGEALTFYGKVFGAEVRMRQPYGDYIPQGCAAPPSDLSRWVLHAEMELAGTVLWFADEAAPGKAGDRVRLTVTVPAKGRAQELFDGLSRGGEITLPPTETFYSAFHAGVTDRFGVCWNIVAEGPPETPPVHGAERES